MSAYVVWVLGTIIAYAYEIYLKKFDYVYTNPRKFFRPLKYMTNSITRTYKSFSQSLYGSLEYAENIHPCPK